MLETDANTDHQHCLIIVDGYCAETKTFYGFFDVSTTAVSTVS